MTKPSNYLEPWWPRLHLLAWLPVERQYTFGNSSVDQRRAIIRTAN